MGLIKFKGMIRDSVVGHPSTSSQVVVASVEGMLMVTSWMGLPTCGAAQAYASLGQGFLHIVQEGKDIPVDMNHGPAFLSQKRMSVLKNIKNHGRQDDMDKRV